MLEKGREYEWEGRYLWVRVRAGRRAAASGNGLRPEICIHCHDHLLEGHQGSRRTIGAIRQVVWWPGMNGDVEQFVHSCVVCAKAEASHLKPGGLLQPLPIPRVPWKR